MVEQTFYKAKRRIAFIDEIRKAADVMIEVYVICPGDELWKENLKKRGIDRPLQRYKEQAKQEIEFPNPAEGMDRIYKVTDGEIRLQMDSPRPEILDKARLELAEEAERIRREDEKVRERKELLESMKTRPFWHYCEVCGKKEYITAQQAFDSGWDYPPQMGDFGLLSPRTCGNCLLKDTLYWRVTTCEKVPLPIVVEDMLTPQELVIWRRIKGEPQSLLCMEEDGEND